MTWLFPLYLLGAAAVALPILLHLRRRPPKDRVVFSSLMFLEQSPQLLTKRSRLERWLLLALRCLALILLALMFARPFVRSGGENLPAGKGEAVVLLLDASASMRRGDLWKQATAEISQRVRKAGVDDRVAVVRFDRESKTLWSFDQDARNAAGRAAQVQAILQRENAGWEATDLGRALVEAVGSFAQSSASSMPAAARRIVVVSDLQEGARLEALRGFAWPDEVVVEAVPLLPGGHDNFTLSLAAVESEDESAKIEIKALTAPSAAGTRVRVSNVRESRAENFSLQWDKAATAPLAGYLPAGASRVMRAPPPPGNEAGDVLVLSGDAWDFDNRVFIAPSQPREARVVFVGDEASANEAAAPLYYLTRALQPTASLRPVLETATAKDAATRLAGASIAFVQGGALQSAGALAPLKNWLEQGGFMVLSLPRDAAPDELRQLTGDASIEVKEHAGEAQTGYAMLGEVNAAHPLLLPFSDPRLRDFTKIRFWRHRQVTWKNDAPQPPQVLASFDDDHPALLLWERGKGRLLVLASGWQPADSQLALSTKFVPLIFGWLRAAGFSHEAAQSVLVGDALPLAAGAATILKPDGKTIEHTSGVSRADMPGFFKLTQDGVSRIIAANLPPEEGRTHPLDPQKLAEAGARLAAGSAGTAEGALTVADQQRLGVLEEEARQRAWFWVLVLLLGILAWETWLAGRKPAAA